jgi:hypothetical protein
VSQANSTATQTKAPPACRTPSRSRALPTRSFAAITLGLLAISSAPSAGAQVFDDAPTEAPVLQPPRVMGGFARETAYVGDAVEYQVIVEVPEDTPEPVVDWPEGLSATPAGRSMSQRSSTGIDASGRAVVNTKRFVTYTYSVTPQRAGTFIVPPARVTISGQTHQTRQASLRVREPEPAPGFSLTAEIERPTLYVGEAARLQLVWTVGSEATPPSLEPSTIPDGFEIYPDLAAIAGVPRTKLYESSIGGTSVAGRVEDGVGGAPTRLVFDLIVRPTRPGAFELGPFTAVFDQTSRSRPRVRAVSRAGAIDVEVISPPAEGRPAGFTGLIGAYELRAQIDRDSVAVGDPVTLTLTLRGPEPLPATLQPPALPSIPELADNFRLSPDGWTEASRSFGEREYTTVIRAARPQAARVPPIVLPTFDPGAGEYVTTATAPIPLRVRAVREVTARDAVVGSPVPAPGGVQHIEPVPLVTSAAAAWAADRAGPVLAARSARTLPERLREPGSIALLSAGPCLAAIALLVRRGRTHRKTPSARRSRAVRRGVSHLARGDHAGAVRAVIADLRTVPEHSVTAADLGTLDLPEPDRQVLAAAVESATRGRYAGHRDPPVGAGQGAGPPALTRAHLSRLAAAIDPVTNGPEARR